MFYFEFVFICMYIVVLFVLCRLSLVLSLLLSLLLLWATGVLCFRKKERNINIQNKFILRKFSFLSPSLSLSLLVLLAVTSLLRIVKLCHQLYNPQTLS